jgi:glycosyltransferase involved in cell wall biosynthesis
MFILNYLPTFSGHAIYLHRIIPLMKEKGYQVEILTSNLGEHPRLDCIDGVSIHRVRLAPDEREAYLRFSFRILLFLFRYRRRFDILHWHGNLDPYGVLTFTCKVLRKRVITQMVLMGSDDPESLKAQYRVVSQRIRLSLIDRFIPVSSPLYKRCVSAGFPPHKLRQIPQGVDTQKFHPVSESEKAAIRLRIGWPQDRKIVTFVGSVIYRKGVDVLIDAWESIQEQCPDTELILVGPCDFGIEDYDASSSNAFVDGIRSQISQHSLNVRLVGRSSEVEVYLQASDVFVLPSRKEGFPNAIIEAMACGLPVVVTQMDGTSVDSVTPGETGIIVSSCEELASALIGLLKDDERRRKFGANARNDVLERFTLAQIADKYMAVYDELL